MFNKSILVALVLCACYLGATQASKVPVTQLLLTGVQAAEAAQQTAEILPNVGGGGGGLGDLTGKVPGLNGGGSGLPVLN